MGPCSLDLPFMNLEHSIGVNVSETRHEMATDAVTVTANSRKTDDPAQEQDRNEHCDQREADRQHRKADFARPFERRLERGLAIFDVPIDILHDDDGVVDHEPDRDGERHQRNGVDAEIEKVHRRKRSEQRQGNGDAGDHRCPNIAQEHENDHYDQANGERECEFDLAYSGADSLCAVEKRLHCECRGKIGREPWQLCLDPVHRFDDVGAGLLGDIQ